MGLLDYQSSVTPFRGMPTHETQKSSTVTAVSAESVAFYYSNNGVRTADTNTAAGTPVVGVLANRPILNQDGTMQATNYDTSLVFSSTALTTERSFPEIMAGQAYDAVSWSKRLTAITSGFANGEYCVDYTNGIIYGVKADTGGGIASAAYKVASAGSGTSSVGTANTPAIVTSAGTAIAANGSRKQWSIQNLGTNPLFVRLGGTASSTVFHYVLKGGTGNDDGTGGSVGSDDVVFNGLISVAGTSPRFTTLEL